MDPHLRALSADQLRGLVTETRPEWAQGRERVGGFQSVQDPLVAQRRFAAPTAEEAQRNVYKTALEEPGRTASTFWDIFKNWMDKGAIGQKLSSLDPESRKMTGMDAFDLAPLPMGGAAAVLVGAKAAKNLGSSAEIKYLLGKQALERGEAAQSVWRKYGVSKTKEGEYVFETPLLEGETDAIRQFSQAYPDVALKVLRGQGPRKGYYYDKGKKIFAQGSTGGPITDFGSRRRVLEHELQHAADAAEGHSYGTNLADPSYRNNAAEVRARAVEQRLDPKERVWEPSFHEDINRPEQVIKRRS